MANTSWTIFNLLHNQTEMQLLFSLFMLLVAGSIWVVFLRAVPRLSAKGVITSKNHKPPGEYTQFHAAIARELGSQPEFPLPKAMSLKSKEKILRSLSLPY